ncbi:MAG TPA: DUF1549 domain-containing protein, partial [Pirellulaceae bacterium]|nr:DUF1549 domain-containing protein [Pirellulaceae bacterium]
MLRILSSLLFLALTAGIPCRGLGDDAEPLHARIDRLIDAQTGGPLADDSSDVEFLRRIYLDVVGRVPSAEETRAFLADSNADKRAAL